MIDVMQADITQFRVDAIVSPNGFKLKGRDPICREIIRQAGPAYLKECVKMVRATGGYPAGDAVITTGGQLSARMVINAVPPIWQGGMANEEYHLKSCYLSILHLAEKFKCQSLAVPSLGTSYNNYPVDQAAHVAMACVKKWLKTINRKIDLFFVVANGKLYDAYRKELILA